MVLPEVPPASVPSVEPTALDERATGASGMRLKVATRPATVGATWLDLFQPGTPSDFGLEARVRVVADVAGALIQIHENPGVPRQHRRHGRLTPRHLLIGVDGSASLFNAKEPFSKLLPPQPDLGYLAPELLTQTGAASQQSDVFSMGVLLWEALDNGRLFPHRRAAAIRRLIARRSLPYPRIEEEWALPLADVAMRALADSPDDRYPDATALWLALREHLPPPDTARAALSRAAQRALRLELTSEIREAPPYIVKPKTLIGTSSPPERASLLEPPLETSARYSLRPEPSSRRPSFLGPSSSAPPKSSALLAPSLEADARVTPEPAPPRMPSMARHDSAPRPPLSETAPRLPPRPLAAPPVAVAPSPEPASEPAVSTLQVNLPRDLVDASLPLIVSSHPAERPFPWGALSFAAVVFFGVGAAVAFGAVTALRTPAPAESSERQPLVVQTVPATPLPSGPALAPAAARPEPSPPGDPAGTPGDRDAVEAAPPVERVEDAEPRPSKSAKARAKPAKPRPSAPKAPPPPSSSAEAQPAESLPIVEQPY